MRGLSGRRANVSTPSKESSGVLGCLAFDEECAELRLAPNPVKRKIKGRGLNRRNSRQPTENNGNIQKQVPVLGSTGKAGTQKLPLILPLAGALSADLRASRRSCGGLATENQLQVFLQVGQEPRAVETVSPDVRADRKTWTSSVHILGLSILL